MFYFDFERQFVSKGKTSFGGRMVSNEQDEHSGGARSICAQLFFSFLNTTEKRFPE